MGTIEFLVVGGRNAPESLKQCIEKLRDSSVIFVHAMQSVPTDIERAGRVSVEAMAFLDHIVNEILRERDDLKAENRYSESELENLLSRVAGLWVSSVTRQQQQALVTAGPGTGSLPKVGDQLNMEKLLNKIKHRRRNEANYRLDNSGRHLFYIAVDKPNQQPDSIVEIDIERFCQICLSISSIARTETE